MELCYKDKKMKFQVLLLSQEVFSVYGDVIEMQ